MPAATFGKGNVFRFLNSGAVCFIAQRHLLVVCLCGPGLCVLALFRVADRGANVGQDITQRWQLVSTTRRLLANAANRSFELTQAVFPASSVLLESTRVFADQASIVLTAQLDHACRVSAALAQQSTCSTWPHVDCRVERNHADLWWQVVSVDRVPIVALVDLFGLLCREVGHVVDAKLVENFLVG